MIADIFGAAPGGRVPFLRQVHPAASLPDRDEVRRILRELGILRVCALIYLLRPELFDGMTRSGIASQLNVNERRLEIEIAVARKMLAEKEA